MRTLTKPSILLLTFCLSSAAFAQNGVNPVPASAPTPAPVSVIPTTKPAPAPVTPAKPVLISAIQNTGSTYSLVFMNTRKIPGTPAQEMATLNTQLNPYGVTPCRVVADINATGINCGNGLVQFGVNELYSYTRPFNLRQLPIAFDKGVQEVFGANFRSPVGLLPGDSIGRNLHVHFNQPVSQFLIHVDSGNTLAPSVAGIQFYVVNGANVASTPIKKLTAPTQYVGVHLASGFTDLVIVPVGGQSQAFAADLFSVVPTANYIP